MSEKPSYARHAEKAKLVEIISVKKNVMDMQFI